MIQFLLSGLLLVLAPGPGRKWTTVERLDPAHLAAVHEARLRLARERSAVERGGVYEDYRAVIHVHAEDAPHTGGKREEVLAAARRAGVKVVLLSDHRGPNPASWNGLRGGVLFLAGAEDDHLLRFPGEPALRFLSHLEEQPDAPAAGMDGMEIYNRHADDTDEEEFHRFFESALKDPPRFKKLAEAFHAWPDEFFGAEQDYFPVLLERFDREIRTHPFTAIAANDAHQNVLYQGTLFDPYEVAFRNLSTHLLARELSEPDIRAALRQGRAYIAHDWLCDPTGFAFVASNNLGVFEMGDAPPIFQTTRLSVLAPVAAQLRLFKDGALVAETAGSRLDFTAKEPGAYRAEAWLEIDGERRPWIYSNAIYLRSAAPDDMRLPSAQLSPGIEAVKDLAYTDGNPEDAAKHKLDLYRPAGAARLPVLFFIHGGSWRSGDRSLYAAFGNRFAKAGIVTVIPSYRLAPKNPHPAQIEDAAAAFAWTVRHIAEYGGDPDRIYVAGHSAGGHLAALLTLDGRYLEKRGVPAKRIRGTMALSGVYEIKGLETVFGPDPQVRKDASPIAHVQAPAPPFLVTYCQWDYATLPLQARRFHQALKAAGLASELVYIPAQSHISEMTHLPQDGDATAAAMLRFMK